MLSEHFAGQEKAIYKAIVALDEGASLARMLADQFGNEMRDRLLREAEDRLTESANLRRLLEQHKAFALE